MCISGAIFEYEASYIDEKERELKGWGFDLNVLRASEGGVSPLLDRRSPRADFTNVHPTDKDMPGFEGTTQQLNNISIYKKEGLTEQEWCHYGGLPSPNAYL